MPPATAEAILGVDEGLLKTCRQYIQEIWYNTRALSIVSTAEGTERFHQDVTEALNMFSQHSPRLDVVAGIYSRAATWEDVNDILSLRCGEDLVWWAVETLRRRWLENTEQQWRFGTAIFPMMKMMTTAMAIRRAVGKTRKPTPVKERNLFGEINAARTTTILPRTMTPEPSSGCPCVLEKSWRRNL
jgi:hypothetical protein